MKKIKRTILICASLFLLASNFWLKSDHFLVGISMGICLAMVFFLLADSINRYLINRKIKSIDLKNGEEIIFAEPSTYYTGNRGAMGKLFLTNKRLVFIKQSVLKLDTAPSIQIERRQIKVIQDYNRAALPTGISLQLKKGQSYAFAVDDREKWKAVLSKKHKGK